MKLHQSDNRPNRFGGETYRTLCGRMNKACSDGMNVADLPEAVTCAFCRKHPRFALLRPTEHSLGDAG